MKDEAILKVLNNLNLIISDAPTTERLTCEEECQAKLVIAITACNLLPDPFTKVACIAAAKKAYENCSDKCD